VYYSHSVGPSGVSTPGVLFNSFDRWSIRWMIETGSLERRKKMKKLINISLHALVVVVFCLIFALVFPLVRIRAVRVVANKLAYCSDWCHWYINNGQFIPDHSPSFDC